MRVLHIGKYYPPFAGGIENFMRDMLPQLAIQNMDIAALVHDHSKGRLPLVEQLGNYYTLRIYRVPCYGQFFYVPISPSFYLYLQRALTAFKPQLIHIHMPNPSAFFLLFSTIARALPWIIHWHSDVVSSQYDKRIGFAYSFYKPFEQAMLRRAKYIIATSPDYLQSSKALSKWQDKAQVIPLGISNILQNSSAIEEKENDPAWKGATTRLLCIGRLTYYKGHRYLLEALAKLSDKNIHCLLIGEGEEQTTLQTLITSLGIQNQVTLLGFQTTERVQALLQQADCVCLPSIERTEAFGLVLLEAMAAKKPVLATKVKGSGMAWVVQDKKTGYLVEPAKVDSLVYAIRDLCQYPDKWKKMGENGQKYCQAHFMMDKIAQKIAYLYRQI